MTLPPTPPRPNSHNRFALACRRDEFVHGLVSVLAALACAAGLLVVLILPYSGPVRACLALAWTAWSLADGRRWSRTARCLSALRLGTAGDWRGLDRYGIWQPLEPAAGSVVTRRFLWLRFRLPDGRTATFAFTPASLPVAGWRRLQAALRLPRG